VITWVREHASTNRHLSDAVCFLYLFSRIFLRTNPRFIPSIQPNQAPATPSQPHLILSIPIFSIDGCVCRAADLVASSRGSRPRYWMMSSWPTGPPPGPYGGRRSRLGSAAFEQGLHRRSPAARLAPFYLNRYVSTALGWVVALNQVVFFTINFRLFCIPLRCKQRLVPFFFDSLFLYLFFRSI
jgi:hypothetical protein